MDPTQLPLKDLQLPETIGLWPPAIGWWIVGLLLLLLIAYLIRQVWRILRHPKRIALAELRLIRQRYAEHQNSQQLIIDCNQLLKRFALTLNPRREVAQLSGMAWVRFLQETVKTAPDGLEPLASGPYQRAPDIDVPALLAACEQWLRRHRGSVDV